MNDRPTLPCEIDLANRRLRAQLEGRERIEPTAFDRLIAPSAGDMPAFAAVEAARMCGQCPIRDACLRDNADEEWVLPVVRVLVRQAEVAA